ncbi:hypothetical protein [Xylophilus sp.]|uniref:hypothetical protein n=1 Tax=Xylophilus sp. TaxID=2653893 RepID=UPI0013B75C08|nr:hypothetical protein [Xylophilus sp.]KAF1043562.1 MAG: hypothetical protein GAK38_03898 [Xylophilus sp.]
MSDSALTLLRMKFFVLDLLERPRRSPAADKLLFDLEFNLRMQAAFVIGRGCDEVADSAARHGAGFCQAGVVAPPDSPGFGKSRTLGA